MNLKVELTRDVIVRPDPVAAGGTVGAWVEFAGVVRGLEDGRRITALEYEAYDSMAERLMRGILQESGRRLGCELAHVIHRVGLIPVGEMAIWIGVGAGHRQEALALVGEFMDRLKEDVPIWKRRAFPE